MTGPTKPYYDEGGITIYHGDSDEVLPLLPSTSTSLILTDPPYNVSERDKRATTTVGRLKRKDGTFRAVTKDFGEWDHGWDPTTFLAESARVLEPGGSLFSFTSEHLMGDYLASALDHRNLVYWRKPNPAPAFRQHYVRAVEMAVWQTKGGKWTFNEGGYCPNVIEGIPIVSGFSTVNNGEPRIHPTQKPVALMALLVDRHSKPGDLVLDPYMGSGTTLVAAKRLGRRSIGIEQQERYCEIAANRLAQGVLDFGSAS